MLKSDEYKQKIVSRLERSLKILFVIIGLLLLIFFIIYNKYLGLKPEVVIIIIIVVGLLLGSLYQNTRWALEKSFLKIAFRLEHLKFKQLQKSDIDLIENYENAVKIYEKALEDYNNKVKAYNDDLKRKVKNFWFSLSGWEFETEFEKLLKQQGFVTHKTSGSADGGVDIFATRGSTRYAVQCKAHKKPTGPSIVRDLYGSMNHNNIKNGILVNLGGFTEGVFDFVRDKSIVLLDIDDVIELHEGKKTLWK
jgi:HJR/Mrr/RecB family endonuclease